MDWIFYLVGAIAAMVLPVAAFLFGRSSGRDSVKAERNMTDEKRRKEFDKIDRGAPDLDGSIDRLRDRSKRDSARSG